MNWKAIGITAISAALLYYPALRLYRYIANRRAAADEKDEHNHHAVKVFSPAYRGKKRVVNRRHHGDADMGHA